MKTFKVIFQNGSIVINGCSFANALLSAKIDFSLGKYVSHNEISKKDGE